MKVGDKVRFLNALGGGIVKEIRGKDIVVVEDEDGFDIPVLSRECVVIKQLENKEVLTASSQTLSPVQLPQQSPKIIVEETPEGESITLALAFLATDDKKMSSTSHETYLVNDSNYFLSYTYLSKVECGWIVRCQGEIEPNTKVFVEELEKNRLNELEKICIQFIAFKRDKAFNLKDPYSIELAIDTVKFYKLHSFRENDYFEKNALIYPLISRDVAGKKLALSPEELKQAMFEKEKPQHSPLWSAKKSPSPILEVDLHANQLLDNLGGLSPTDILQYQLAKFNDVMKEHLKNKGQKIVFIHGKGDGVLKKKINDELSKKYKSVYVQDASFREYGFGATMVTIK